MQPHDRTGRARNARLNQAAKHADELVVILRGLQGHTKNQHIDDKDRWFDARTALESLTQCVHEANAYNNVIQPRGPTVKPSDFDSENHGSNPCEAATASPMEAEGDEPRTT